MGTQEQMEELMDAYIKEFGSLPFGMPLDPEHTIPLLQRALRDHDPDVFYEGLPKDALV
jgi:hypothetical protein